MTIASMNKRYYKAMPGRDQEMLDEFLAQNFIAVDFGVNTNMAGMFTGDFRDFNKNAIPIVQSFKPEKTKVSAGLAAGCIWRVGYGMQMGDIVLCPNAKSELHVGEVSGDYFYSEGNKFPHRRKVTWLPKPIRRSDCSDALQNALKAGLSVFCLDEYAEEIQHLINGDESQISLHTSDATIENPTVFALEKYLEEFLIANWDKTELAQDYLIYSEEGEKVGQQYQTDTGPIDILAISKDQKTLLVIELKKGRASDVVVGQIQRYMGFVIEELAEQNQTVKGLIIALDDDLRIRRALAVAKNIDFYRYAVTFKLFPAVAP